MRKNTKSAIPVVTRLAKLSANELPETLALVIPCRTGKPDRLEPIYRVKLNELGGVERGAWQCMQCGKIFHTRIAWKKHAGMVCVGEKR